MKLMWQMFTGILPNLAEYCLVVQFIFFLFVILQQLIPPNITQCVSCNTPFHHFAIINTFLRSSLIVLGDKTLLPMIITWLLQNPPHSMISTWCSPRSFCALSSEEQIPPSSLPPRNSCLSSDCLIFLDCIVFVGLSNLLPGVPLPLSVDVRGLLPDKRVVFRLSRICMFVNVCQLYLGSPLLF